jgi:hypothetical protein
MKKISTKLYWLLPPIVLGCLTLPFVGWGFTDDDVFILHYLAGHSVPLVILSEMGRFLPLEHQEWRLVSWMTEAWMFHGVALLQYAIFCFALWCILSRLNALLPSAFFFLATLPPVVVSFCNIVVPERNQLMLLALCLLCYIAYQNGRLMPFAFLSLIFANVALYFKEPTSLFLGGFAVVQLLPLRRASEPQKSYLQRHWLDIAILISCATFFLVYFSTVSMTTLLSPAAYGGNGINLENGFSSIARWTVKEPLLFPLLTTGALLSAYRRLIFADKYLSITLSLWCGAVLYTISLISLDLVSKYYAAVPLLGFALHSYIEAHGILKSSVRVLLRVLICANFFLWAPALLYKYDWTERYSELAHQLSSSLRANDRNEVLIVDSGSWDTAMFIIYMEYVRQMNIRFYCNYSNNVTWLRGDHKTICPVRDDEYVPGIKIDLGGVQEGRTARLIVKQHEIWHYESTWIRWIPASIRNILAPHYNFW